MKKSGFAFLCLTLCYACTDKSNYPLSDYRIDYDGVLDTILPYFASLHDSIPADQRFLLKNRHYMMVHKIERLYEWMHYTEKDGYSYFMVSRVQPSLKKDKFLSICGRFKRDKNGRIDSASFEELFWTWKMKKDSLLIKSDTLFSAMVETGDIERYTPEKSNGYWIEFPSRFVYYDKATQSWKTRPSY